MTGSILDSPISTAWLPRNFGARHTADKSRIVLTPQSTGKFLAHLKVLVVDDERLIRWSLRQGFTQRGHHVVEAGDAASAIDQLSVEPGQFSVVLLDYRLPDRQDLTLLRAIRTIAPAAAVFMMTAYGEREMRIEALALGARAVIDKPFQVSDVVALVESQPPDGHIPS